MKNLISRNRSMLIALTLVSFGMTLSLNSAFAQSVYDEGTETELTQAAVQDLIAWSRNSKLSLDRTRNSADPIRKPVEAQQVYLDAIKKLIPESSPSIAETLMRYSLNRARVAVETIQSETSTLGEVGTSVGSIDIQVHLLKLSIDLALRYYQSDIEFLEGQAQRVDRTLGSLPFSEFGIEYSKHLSGILDSVSDASAQYALAKLALEWLHVDLNKDLNLRVRYSPVITDIRDYVKALPEAKHLTDAKCVALTVELRRKLQNALLEINQLNPTSRSN